MSLFLVDLYVDRELYVVADYCRWGLRAEIEVSKNGVVTNTMYPEKRSYPSNQESGTMVAI